MINCFRSNEIATKDKEALEKAKEELSDEKLDTTSKINKTLKAYDALRNHEQEKLKSLQDEALFKKNLLENSRDKVRSKAIDASKAKLKYLNSKYEAVDQVKTYHDVVQEQDRLKKKLSDLSKQLEKAPEFKGGKQKVDTEETSKLKQEILDVKSQIKDTDWKQEQLKKSAIKNHMARLDRTAAELKRRISEKDFAPKQINRNTIETPEIEAKRKEVDQLRLQMDKLIEKTEYENRTQLQKAMDFANNFKRFSILSSPKSLAKLAAASTEVALARGYTESIGYGLSKIPILKKIGEMAPIEGPTNRLGDDVKTYFRGFLKGVKERDDILSGRGGYLEQKFGKESGVPQNWLGWVGRLHEYVKNPTRLANYEVGVNRYLRWAESQGLNPRDPVVINQAETEAFKYANESIFKENNKVVEIYQNSINSLKKGGAGSKAVAFALEQTLPIVKIPTNILKQTFDYAFGTIPATAKIFKAVNEGIENIKPEDADTIMKQMKRGSAGLVMMAIGVAFSDKIGGLYLTGEDKGDEEYGSAFSIPRVLLENPLFACLQIGATTKRFWDNHFEEADLPSEKAEFFATLATKVSLGLIEEAPFVKSMLDLDKIIHSRDRVPETLAEIYARPYIPAVLQYAADVMDAEQPLDQSTLQEKASTLLSPHPTARDPQNVMQVMAESLPYFRQRVPEK
jgi:hypothetical protein